MNGLLNVWRRLGAQSPLAADMLPVALLLLALLLVCWQAIDAPGFAIDDSYHLYLASRGEWWRFLYSPAVYQRISTAYLTPFSVAYYTFAKAVGGFSAASYLRLHLLLFGGWLWSLALLLRLRFRLQLRYLLLFVALAFCIGYVGTLLSRFYTEHYVLGGICSAWALLALDCWQRGRRAHWLLVAACLLLLAMLEKEVFLGMPLICLLLCWHDVVARRVLLPMALALWASYFAYRGYMLGTLVGGRAGHQSLLLLLQSVIAALPGFTRFYFSTHALLLPLFGLAFALAPRVALTGGLCAAILLAPSLAAPHAFLQPELNADRLFIAADLVLAATVAVSIARRGRELLPASGARIVVLLSLLAGLGWSWYLARVYQRQFAASSDYRITHAILESRQTPAAVYLPPAFNNGSLVAAFASQARKPFPVSANCLEALGWTMPGALFFAASGELVAREQLAQQCRPLQSQSLPRGEIIFDRGVMSWHLRGQSAESVGIYFLAHALFIPAADFEERLLRPAPDEPYLVFARHGDEWWFSAPQVVRFAHY